MCAGGSGESHDCLPPSQSHWGKQRLQEEITSSHYIRFNIEQTPLFKHSYVSLNIYLKRSFNFYTLSRTLFLHLFQYFFSIFTLIRHFFFQSNLQCSADVVHTVSPSSVCLLHGNQTHGIGALSYQSSCRYFYGVLSITGELIH